MPSHPQLTEARRIELVAWELGDLSVQAGDSVAESVRLDAVSSNFVTMIRQSVNALIGSEADQPSKGATAAAMGLAKFLPSPTQSAGTSVNWWDAARSVLAEVVMQQVSFATAGLRGGSITFMDFKSGDIHIDVEIEPVRTHTRHLGAIRGQVEAKVPLAGASAVFIGENGEPAASTTLDDSGFFEAILPEGVYDLAIGAPSGTVRACGLKVA